MNQDDNTSGSFQQVQKDDTSNELNMNILLLGESGVGKSTFINAIVNYLDFPSFDEANNAEELTVLVPTKFKFFDTKRKQHYVEVGDNSDENENIKIVGASATQNVKTYLFPIPNDGKKIRLIDTPGVGDTRGTEVDRQNCENILSCLAMYQQIHAICILLKPNVSRLTPSFIYVIKTILSQLDNSAAKNIIFCFTHTRGTDFTPGDTLDCLEEMVKQIKQVEIPCENNIFCFDNEAFRCLSAKNTVLDSIYTSAAKSWNNSSLEFKRMIEYIAKLSPHDVSKILCINEARNTIFRLSKPLVEISDYIQQNIKLMENHKAEINDKNISLEKLRENLYIPVTKIETNQLSRPALVCTDNKCVEVYEVNGGTMYHYKTRCHDPCNLKNIEQKVIGAEELLKCINIKNRTCDQCKCSYKFHMRINYETFATSDKEINKNVETNINNEENILKEKEKLIKELEVRKNKLEEEQNIITEACAQFAHFLQDTAIMPYNDAIKEYLLYMIERERSCGNEDTINNLKKLYDQYMKLKSSFDIASTNGESSINFTPKNIHDKVEKLFSLEYYGEKLKKCFDCQTTSHKVEWENIDYVHKPRSLIKSVKNLGISIFNTIVGNKEQAESNTFVVSEQEPKLRDSKGVMKKKK